MTTRNENEEPPTKKVKVEVYSANWYSIKNWWRAAVILFLIFLIALSYFLIRDVNHQHSGSSVGYGKPIVLVNAPSGVIHMPTNGSFFSLKIRKGVTRIDGSNFALDVQNFNDTTTPLPYTVTVLITPKPVTIKPEDGTVSKK